MTKDSSLRDLVRDFLEHTDVSKAALGRRAGGMVTNTIDNVLKGKPHSDDTDRRLREALASYAQDWAAFTGEHGDELEAAADDIGRQKARRR